jgi:hypothetical protein
MRYRFAELRREWNRNAKPGHKIAGESGYEALKSEARTAHEMNGRREFEMSGFQTKTGNPVLLQF